MLKIIKKNLKIGLNELAKISIRNNIRLFDI